MNMALVKQHSANEHPIDQALYQSQADSRVVMELDNVAHALKHFAHQLSHAHAAHAQFAHLVQLKTWALNKPTLQTLLEEYLLAVQDAQVHLHLDQERYDEAMHNLCDQLVFLSAVFEQECALLDQTLFDANTIVVCD
ncbi:MAG TPA: hypothetical protein VFV57_00310 [Limnobacter sp.]|nr:hypothetical protein [Limnobacter sp.]